MWILTLINIIFGAVLGDIIIVLINFIGFLLSCFYLIFYGIFCTSSFRVRIIAFVLIGLFGALYVLHTISPLPIEAQKIIVSSISSFSGIVMFSVPLMGMVILIFSK